MFVFVGGKGGTFVFGLIGISNICVCLGVMDSVSGDCWLMLGHIGFLSGTSRVGRF